MFIQLTDNQLPPIACSSEAPVRSCLGFSPPPSAFSLGDAYSLISSLFRPFSLPASLSWLLFPWLSCNFAAPTGVLGTNDDSPVQNETTGLIPPEDFTDFMRRYQDMVFSTSVRLLGNETQAEDISQEVFIKAYDHWDNLCGNPAAGGWLKTVATNLSLNHLQRYRKRWRFFSEFTRHDDEGGEDATPVEFAAPDTFFDAMQQGERRAWVDKALEQLPQNQRVPLVLFHFEDMPYDEIARRLGVSLAKVKTDILRGRAALAKILVQGAGAEQLQTR